MPNVRRAEERDNRDIFEWRNDEVTRQMAHTTELVEWDEHSAWFAASLIDTKRLLVICEEEDTDQKIAIVRFDIKDERALVSINLSPQMRGRRKAKPCLRDAISFFQLNFSEIRFFDAEIKSINIPSQKSFTSVGFVLVKQDAQVLYYEYAVQFNSPKKRILFLGYDHTQTKLHDALIANKCSVDHSAEKIDVIKGYDCVISYGYRYILKQSTIDGFECPVFNLHISYLPYNRGAHPNFWAFYDNTPSGVTIHLIDRGIDTGPIVKQKYVTFKKSDDTFVKTYGVLVKNIEDLFLEFLPSLLNDTWTAKNQSGEGSFHYAKDLPSNFSGWDAKISDEIKRLNSEGLKYDNK